MVNIRRNLREHPILGTFVLIILYLIFLTIATTIPTILVPIQDNISFITYIFAEFVFIFIILSIFWLLIVPYGLHLPSGKESFSEYLETIHLSKIQPLGRNILIGVTCTIVNLISVLVASLILGGHNFDPNIILGNPDINKGQFGWGLFIYMLKAGVWEEIAFRGVILSLLLNKYSQNKALIIDGVAFGILHLANLMMAIGSPEFGLLLVLTVSQIIYASCLGIVQGYELIKTKSLLPPMLTHYLINVGTQIFIVVEVTNIFIYSIYLVLSIGLIPLIINILLINFIIKRTEPTFKSNASHNE